MFGVYFLLWCCSFPKAERQRLNAALVERGLATACRFTDAKLANLKLMPYPKEFVQLRCVQGQCVYVDCVARYQLRADSTASAESVSSS